MKDYQKMWESLKKKIETNLRFHESGEFQTMTESIMGAIKCKEVLGYMKKIEDEET